MCPSIDRLSPSSVDRTIFFRFETSTCITRFFVSINCSTSSLFACRFCVVRCGWIVLMKVAKSQLLRGRSHVESLRGWRLSKASQVEVLKSCQVADLQQGWKEKSVSMYICSSINLRRPTIRPGWTELGKPIHKYSYCFLYLLLLSLS